MQVFSDTASIDVTDITPYLGKLIRFRRDLHAHPELRFEEVRTSDQ